MKEFSLIDLRGKTVMVAGMARSGIAAAKLLCAKGIIPLLYDEKGRGELGMELEELEGLSCRWHLAEDPLPLLPQCDGVVVSPGVPIQSPLIQRSKQLDLPLIGELELGAMCLQGRMAAITGTNGKTTTTTLLGEILRNAGKTVHVVGNIGVPITSVALFSNPEDISVVEVSSFQLETTRHFAPDVAALLNLTEDHLNRHGAFAVYAALKRRIFENQRPDQVAVLNACDATVAKMAADLPGEVHWFSRLEDGQVSLGAGVREEAIELRDHSGSRILMPAADVSLPGPHNLENALAAAAMAQALDIPDAVIVHTLRTFAGVEHRMELVATIDGVRYINDSKGTNVDATQNAIAAMQAPTVIILGGSEKGVSFAPLARTIVSSPNIRDAVLIGETADSIEAALHEAGFASAHKGFDSLDEALRKAASLTEAGWNVLLSPACASFDMFQNYEHRGRVFKELVRGMES